MIEDRFELIFLILNYMDYDMTANLVMNIKQSVTKYPSYGIVIVDNNSPNESYAFLKEKFEECSDVFVIKNNENQGYARGNNFGLRFIEKNFQNCKYVAISNPDIEFPPDTNLISILKKLDKHENLAAISPIMLLNGTFNPEIIAWKTQRGFDDIFLTFGTIRLLFNPVKYRKFKMGPERISYVEVLPGSFFIIKLQVFKEVGYFDENTFLYCEERILGKKLLIAGYKQAVDFDSFFIHKHLHKSNFGFGKKIKFYNYLLESRVYYNITYNKPAGWLVAALLYVLYPLKILEMLIAELLKKL